MPKYKVTLLYTRYYSKKIEIEAVDTDELYEKIEDAENEWDRGCEDSDGGESHEPVIEDA